MQVSVEASRAIAEIHELDRQRRAKLTPAQLQAEDRARARALAASKQAAVESKVSKAAAKFKGMPTLTLREFAYLLRGVPPGSDDWTMFKADGVEDLEELLGRYTRTTPEHVPGVPLFPVNYSPATSVDKFRYPKDLLFAVALGAQLGYVETLARVMGYRPPPPPMVVAPPPAHAALPPPIAPAERTTAIPPPPVPAPPQDESGDLLEWQQNVVEFMQIVEASLEARAKARGADLGAVRDEFLSRCRYPALYAEWKLRQRDGVAPATQKTFRTFLGAEFEWLRFGGGAKAQAGQYLKELLESEPSGA